MPGPMDESERDRIIRESLEVRLAQERARLSSIFSPGSKLDFDAETGYWNVGGSFDSKDPLGGQKFSCSLRAGGPFSRAGLLGGFKLNVLSVGGHLIFDQSTDDFDFSFVPPPPTEDEDQPKFFRLLDEEAMFFDPEAGEVLFYGLNKPEHLVAIIHEISHGKLERSKRYEVGRHYDSFIKLTGDISFAKERLESGDGLTPEEKERYGNLADYQVTEADMVFVRVILQEELRADLDLLDRLTPMASDVFPNDPGLVTVRRFLSEAIGTYLEGVKSLGAGKYLTPEEKSRLINLV